MSDQISPSPGLRRGHTDSSQSNRFFAFLTWIGQNSPETKGSEIRRLQVHNFGRPFIAGLRFKLIHTEVLWEMHNATDDSEHRGKVVLCSQIPFPAKPHGPDSNRSSTHPRPAELLCSACANIPGRFQITVRNQRDSWALHNTDTSLELHAGHMSTPSSKAWAAPAPDLLLPTGHRAAQGIERSPAQEADKQKHGGWGESQQRYFKGEESTLQSMELGWFNKRTQSFPWAMPTLPLLGKPGEQRRIAASMPWQQRNCRRPQHEPKTPL